MQFLKRIWDGLKWLAGLVFPMFAGARAPRGRAGPVLRRLIHLALLAIALVVLWVVNVRFGLDQYLRAPLPALREVWLPLLFLLLYTLCWLGWWLWRLLGPEQELARFPDIDQAWDEAMLALDQAGIGPTEAPLFLVLGRAAGSDKALFNAAQLPLQVRQAPRRIDAPLYVSAHREGIYLSCAGASLLGRQADILAGEAESSPDRAGSSEPSSAATATGPNGAFSAADLPPGGLLPDEDGPGSSATGTSLQAVESQHSATSAALLVADEEAGLPQRASRPRSFLLKDVDEVDRLSSRLRYLGQRIARERRPYCPINGILVLIPFAATDNDTDAKETASLCQRDLTTIREVLQIQCPIVAVVCDLERAAGCGEFLNHFPEGQRRRLLGQEFPLVPDLDAPARLRMIEKGVQWIANVLFPTLVSKFWSVEAEGGDAITSNIRLYRFLEQLRERQKRLARILTRGIVLQAQGPSMLAGCYLAGTGRDPREQGFLAGAFRHLIENQNYVSWAPEALAEEADYRRWTAYGYFGLTLIIIAFVLVLAFLAW